MLLPVHLGSIQDGLHYGLMVAFLYLHFTLPRYHHYEGVSEGTELLKTCKVHSGECVSQIKSVLSIIFHAIYGTVCIQLAHFSYDDCENMCPLSYHCHQIWFSLYREIPPRYNSWCSFLELLRGSVIYLWNGD